MTRILSVVLMAASRLQRERPLASSADARIKEAAASHAVTGSVPAMPGPDTPHVPSPPQDGSSVEVSGHLKLASLDTLRLWREARNAGTLAPTEGAMTPSEAKTMAEEALETLRQEALHDGTTYADAKGPGRLDDVCESLRRHLAAPASSNPHYPMGEMAAALVLLAATDPDTYQTLVGPVRARDRKSTPPSLCGDGTPATLRGLLGMENLIRGLSDDHDYALDCSGDVPVIRMQWDIVPWVPGLSPLRLLEAVRPLLERSLPSAPRSPAA